MITYDNRAYLHIVFRWSGSLIWSKLVVVPTIVSCIICVVAFQNPEPSRLPEHLEWPAWVYSTVLAFAIIFRTALAYRRFWEGVAASLKMMSFWRSAFVNLLGFVDASLEEHRARGNTEVVEEILEARARLLHWFSLLFAVAAQTLQWREEPDMLRPMHEAELEELEKNGGKTPFWAPIDETEKCERIYIQSTPTQRELVLLGNSFDKLTLITQWIEHEIGRMHLFNRIFIHSSILTRIFEELSHGALAYCEAHTIASIPFPFLFAQVLCYALYSFSVLCPFVVQASVGFEEGSIMREPWSWPALVVMNILLVAGFAGLNEIATELEDPFREKLNNFPLRALQQRADWSMENASQTSRPQDFVLASLGKGPVCVEAVKEDRAMKKALEFRRRKNTQSAETPLGSIMNACEELRLSLAHCVRDLERDGEQLRGSLRHLEMQTCELAYDVLLQRGMGLAAVEGLQPLSVPGHARDADDSALPPHIGIQEHNGEATAGDAASLRDALAQLLDETEPVNRQMSTLLIREVCFRRQRAGCR